MEEINTNIKILPDNIANKIAAGEVVQRPESVVKELIENSLDAGAKNIELFIKRAGKVLIQVVDDGVGMSESDAKMCLQRHATSKIAEFEDLEKLATYGFRGEAMSSIASVSSLEIKTERHDDEIGTVVRYDDSSGLTIEKGSFPKGTSVSVKNLFYNTPARRNFLKSNATELKHIIDTFKRSALPHPEISFKFYNEDDLIFNYSKCGGHERMEQIFADNIHDALVEVKELTEYLSVTGYVSKPTYLRKSKGEQYLFINKRFVRSKSLNHAVFSAFENILEPGDYPFFVLFIELDPKNIDLNVHPQKLEVKFEDEKGIYSFVHAVIKKSLGAHDLVPNISLDENEEKLKFGNYNRSIANDFSDRPDFVSKPFNRVSRESAFSDDELDQLFGNINKEIKSRAPDGPVSSPFEQDGAIPHTSTADEQNVEDAELSSPFIVSLHNKYILTQIKTGLMIIDAHVAHERILYEKALASLNSNLPFSQQLLFSQTVSVDPADYELAKLLEPHLTKLGFQIKFFGGNTVVIEGVPSDVKVGNETELFKEMLREFKTNEREKDLDELHNVAASFSCKAAIKAGDRLSENEMRILVDQLFATSMPYVCPHGRPIIIKIPLTEFDKRFGRT